MGGRRRCRCGREGIRWVGKEQAESRYHQRLEWEMGGQHGKTALCRAVRSGEDSRDFRHGSSVLPRAVLVTAGGECWNSSGVCGFLFSIYETSMNM